MFQVAIFIEQTFEHLWGCIYRVIVCPHITDRNRIRATEKRLGQALDPQSVAEINTRMEISVRWITQDPWP